MITAATLLQSKGSSVWTVEPAQTVYEALQVLAERNIGVVPVVEDGQLVGIFSERDYARRIVLYGRNSKDTQVAEVMTANVQTASPDDTIQQCMQVVVNGGFRHLPVVEEGNLVGVISSTDLLAEMIRDQERKIGNLESFISSSGEVS